MMRKNSHFSGREENHAIKPLENPILFDHYINKNLYPESKPKSKSAPANKEGWKYYATLCLALLAAPIIMS